MPNLRNAKKAVRQSEARSAANKTAKDRIHRWELKTKTLIAENKKEDAVKAVSFLTKLLDKAAQRNVVSGNRAERVKSRMQKLLNTL
jgi:small subunit ribosomal protein S20